MSLGVRNFGRPIPLASGADQAESGGFLFAGCAALLKRLIGIAVLISAEALALSSYVDPQLFGRDGGLIALHPGHIWRGVVAFLSLAITFGLITARSEFDRISRELETIPIGWGKLGGHLGAALIFLILSGRIVQGVQTGWSGALISGLWLGAGIGAVALAWLSVLPWRVCKDLLQSTRGVWAVGAAGAICAVGIEDFRRLLWGRVIGLTVNVVSLLLHPFVHDLSVNPMVGSFSTHAFHLVITPECAGFEGAGLMLVFTGAWLLIFRKECRFPHVLILVPASIVLAWILNSVRLAVLFLIGNSGAPGVALGGFHSQAGWIAFSGLAFGFVMVLQHVPTLKKKQVAAEVSYAGSPQPEATAAYLMPFLAILAVSMLTRAVSAGFEWLYPVRFFAAVLVLWHYRRTYRTFGWTFGWPALVTGCFVGAMWLGLDQLNPSGSSFEVASALVGLSPGSRLTWMFFRVLAACTSVPVAEELAFRGFLLRRLVSANFETVKPERFTWVAVIVSSIAFGLLHGNRWAAGILAGLMYAWTFYRRGKVGDAIAAHAVTNGLLAIWVLITGDWDLW